MTTYSIHYRLDQERIPASYDQRYRDLQAAIKRVAGNLGSHVDATSTVWIRTSEGGESIAKTLKLAVDPRYDVVLVKIADSAMLYAVGDSIDPIQFELETSVVVFKV